MDRLRLIAVDTDDLAIVSAHCQDAITRLGDCRYRKANRQFVMEINRFVWEKAVSRGFRLFAAPQYERRRAVLHFDRVTAVRQQGIDPTDTDQVLVLLAIRFEETEAPSGEIKLIFAGGGTIGLTVEVIEAQLTDVGGAWSTPALPDHDRSAS